LRRLYSRRRWLYTRVYHCSTPGSRCAALRFAARPCYYVINSSSREFGGTDFASSRNVAASPTFISGQRSCFTPADAGWLPQPHLWPEFAATRHDCWRSFVRRPGRYCVRSATDWWALFEPSAFVAFASGRGCWRGSPSAFVAFAPPRLWTLFEPGRFIGLETGRLLALLRSPASSVSARAPPGPTIISHSRAHDVRAYDPPGPIGSIRRPHERLLAFTPGALARGGKGAREEARTC